MEEEEKNKNNSNVSQFCVSYYNGVHELCAQLWKSYREYESIYVVVLSILAVSATSSVNIILRIAIGIVALLFGMLFLYRISLNLSIEDIWLDSLIEMQNKLKKCCKGELESFIMPYRRNPRKKVGIFFWIFYVPLFLWIPSFFLTTYLVEWLLQKTMSKYIPLTIIIFILLVPVSFGLLMYIIFVNKKIKERWKNKWLMIQTSLAILVKSQDIKMSKKIKCILALIYLLILCILSFQVGYCWRVITNIIWLKWITFIIISTLFSLYIFFVSKTLIFGKRNK